MLKLDILEIDNLESDSNNTSDTDFDSYDCNHYEAIMNLNGLKINVIIAKESILLDLIDSIQDKEQQRAMIEKVLAASKEKKKLKPKMDVLVNLAYSMTGVLG